MVPLLAGTALGENRCQLLGRVEDAALRRLAEEKRGTRRMVADVSRFAYYLHTIQDHPQSPPQQNILQTSVVPIFVSVPRLC